MIQRIQTLWLALAFCCAVLCFLFPLAEYSTVVESTGQEIKAQLNLLPKDNPEMMTQMAEGAPVVDYSQRMSGFRTWPLTLLTVLWGAIAVGVIFLYRRRMTQMKIVSLGFLLNLVYVFLVFFWAVDAFAKLLAPMGGGEPHITWHVAAYAPIVSLLFFVLARRGIRNDEAKVRAADRLR